MRSARRRRTAARSAERASQTLWRLLRTSKRIFSPVGTGTIAHSDRPFPDAQGRRLENFTRVEAFGDNAANGVDDVQWLGLTSGAWPMGDVESANRTV